MLQADLSSAEELTAKYRLLAKVITVLCWLFVAWHMFHYVYQLFVNGRLDDLTLILLEDAAPEAVVYVVKAGLIVLQLQTFATRPTSVLCRKLGPEMELPATQ